MFNSYFHWQAYMHTHLQTHKFTHTQTHKHTHTNSQTHTRTCKQTRKHTDIHQERITHTQAVQALQCKPKQACIHAYNHTCTCLHTHFSTHTHTHLNITCTQAVQAHAHARTHIPAHTHTPPLTTSRVRRLCRHRSASPIKHAYTHTTTHAHARTHISAHTHTHLNNITCTQAVQALQRKPKQIAELIVISDSSDDEPAPPPPKRCVPVAGCSISLCSEVGVTFSKAISNMWQTINLFLQTFTSSCAIRAVIRGLHLSPPKNTCVKRILCVGIIYIS